MKIAEIELVMLPAVFATPPKSFLKNPMPQVYIALDVLQEACYNFLMSDLSNYLKIEICDGTNPHTYFQAFVELGNVIKVPNKDGIGSYKIQHFLGYANVLWDMNPVPMECRGSLLKTYDTESLHILCLDKSELFPKKYQFKSSIGKVGVVYGWLPKGYKLSSKSAYLESIERLTTEQAHEYGVEEFLEQSKEHYLGKFKNPLISLARRAYKIDKDSVCKLGKELEDSMRNSLI